MVPKFRAFYKKYKVICVVNSINFVTKEVELDFETVDQDYYWTTSNVPMESVILLQSTGLKDKNGVEIFEGDVYRYKYYTGGGFEYRNSIIEWETTEIPYEGVFHGYEFDNYEIEIIGNIYQNNDLI